MSRNEQTASKNSFSCHNRSQYLAVPSPVPSSRADHGGRFTGGKSLRSCCQRSQSKVHPQLESVTVTAHNMAFSTFYVNVESDYIKIGGSEGYYYPRAGTIQVEGGVYNSPILCMKRGDRVLYKRPLVEHITHSIRLKCRSLVKVVNVSGCFILPQPRFENSRPGLGPGVSFLKMRVLQPFLDEVTRHMITEGTQINNSGKWTLGGPGYKDGRVTINTNPSRALPDCIRILGFVHGILMFLGLTSPYAVVHHDEFGWILLLPHVLLHVLVEPSHQSNHPRQT